MAAERLQKVLAAAGVASRRHSEQLIRAGRVRVDGEVVTLLGTRVDPQRQQVVVDGRPVRPPQRRHYLLLNKPPGYLTTAHDPEGRPTVFDLLPTGPRLVAVGRLDWDSEGLLLLTDDGDVAYRAAHPRFGLEKEYHVWTAHPQPAQEEQLERGVLLNDGPTALTQVRLVSEGAVGAILAIIVHEGRNRQVRRMLAAVGLPVYRLVRVRLGALRLGRLAPGAWRELTAEEVAWLRQRSASAETGEHDREALAGVYDRD